MHSHHAARYSLLLLGTGVAPNPLQPANSTAVAVNPNGGQVLASFDVNSVPPTPPTRFLRLDSFHHGRQPERWCLRRRDRHLRQWREIFDGPQRWPRRERPRG